MFGVINFVAPMKWQSILAKVSLVCVFLVIIAGSVVRMTGSGMGCPDWPKCFGYLIPPTDVETLTWKPDREFQKGQMILKDEALFVAQSNFVSGENYSPENWKEFTQHDYALFNPAHTWTEYINRLIGAFTGLPVLLLFVVSVYRWKSSSINALLAAAVLVMLGFEAWLGKLVVDGNLIPNQITIHMMGAMVLVALLVTIINRLKTVRTSKKESPLPGKTLRMVLTAGIVLGLIQIVLGTQVREEVDVINRTTGLSRNEWVGAISSIFEIHRSFAILVLVVNGWVIYRLWKMGSAMGHARGLAAVLVLEIGGGIALSYLGFPRAIQPAHLLLAMLMFAIQLDLLWKLARISIASRKSSPQTG